MAEPSNDDIVKAAVAVAMENPEITKMAQRLTILGMQKLLHYLEHGTPQFQMQISKMIGTAMVREMIRKGDQEDGNQELREEWRQFQAKVLGESS